MENAKAIKGLVGVIAAETNLSFIDGMKGVLIYKGYNIHALAQYSTFEETAYLLWYGKLPTQKELKDLKETLVANRSIPDPVLNLILSAPKTASPMDILRSAVSLLGLYDQDAGPSEADSEEGNLRKAQRLTAQFPTIIAAIDRQRQEKKPISFDPKLSHAANFFYMLTGERPTEQRSRDFDICLILHADHGFNASTFSARVTISTLSDLHSAITSAIGTLKGPLHGGANERVIQMLKEIGSVDRVETFIRESLSRKEKIPGFGHRVYRTEDPRATVLREMSKRLGEENGESKWYEMSRKVEEVMKSDKGISLNVDFYSASVYHSMGISPKLFTPIFALARIIGWTGHVIEQLQDNRIIRPSDLYIGSKNLKYTPIQER
ncbi:citrate synthase [candidate division TA06 bacterium]|nr:citrate synthase [candidate division TA06 bacterium]